MAAILTVISLAVIPAVCLSTLHREKVNHVHLNYMSSPEQEKENYHSITSRKKRAAVSFVSEKDGKLVQENGHAAFRDILASNPGTFLPTGVNITYPISVLMKRIFDFSDRNWEKQKDMIAQDLYDLYHQDAWKIGLCSSKIALFKTMLQRCSAGTFFGRMNEVLRNYNRNRDSNLRSFALLLNVILFEWPEVTQSTQTTYRGFTSGIDEYQVGLTFAWVDFTTATFNETVACQKVTTALFVIDNTELSNYRPRSIAEYSLADDEHAFLYPVAVLFHVDRIRRGACGDVSIPTIYISIEAGDYTLNHGRISVASCSSVILLCVLCVEFVASGLFYK